MAYDNVYKVVTNRKGVLGSCVTGADEKPILIYPPRESVVPEYGLLLAFDNQKAAANYQEINTRLASSAAIEQEDVLEIWVADADVVEAPVTRLLANLDHFEGWQLAHKLRWFWNTSFPRSHHFQREKDLRNIPAHTVFCSRIRLVQRIG